MKTEYSKKELYKIKNAVIITTPLSILVLDDKERIINQCSHNAAESVLIWYRKQKDKLKYSQHNKAMFIGVQQTFNMGHWFIDTVPLLEYGINSCDEDINDVIVIADTVEHELIQETFKYYGINRYEASLPHRVIRIKELYVPIIQSFEERCRLRKS